MLLFAVVGRASHEEGLTVVGVARTAWPFLVGAGVGLAWSAWSGTDPRHLRAGVRVWLLAVVAGMVLRRLTDAGTAASFVVVATVVLGALFVGWRLAHRARRLAAWWPRRRL